MSLATTRHGRSAAEPVRPPAGVTLLELVIVLAVLGLLAGVVGLAPRTAPWGIAGSGDDNETLEAIASARRSAIATGRSVSVTVETAGGARSVRALPDGRLLGAEALGFDPITGRGLEQGDAEAFE